MAYMGAKTGQGIYQAIIALMPPHDTYIEAFAGTAAIYKLKPAAEASYLIERDREQAQTLANEVRDRRGRSVLCEDALRRLDVFDPRPFGRVLIYADPPYLLSTRTSLKRYRHDFTEADHLKLAAALSRLAGEGVAIILSGYPSALYDALYAGWNTRELQAMTRGGPRTEKLWYNFEPGAAHWSTFAGRDFTDRQRIKRKATSWAKRFAAMPPAERQAVLAAILEAGDRS
jgi:DNA adenine methylase